MEDGPPSADDPVMHPEQFSRMVAASVMPVVVISAAALLCLAFYNRLAAVILRLRAVQRERLELQDRLERRSSGDDEKHTGLRYTCILESLSDQSVGIMKRAHLIRRTLFSLLACIACLVACSLFNGLTVVWPLYALTAVSAAASSFRLKTSSAASLPRTRLIPSRSCRRSKAVSSATLKASQTA